MIRKIIRKGFLGVLLLAVFLQLGTIRRNENPIAKAQTDPISLDKKNEETKDGVKGAPTPSFTYYDKQDFLTKIPMKTPQEAVAADKMPAESSAGLEAVTEVSHEPGENGSREVLPEESAQPSYDDMPESSEEGDDWWMEDQAQDSGPK